MTGLLLGAAALPEPDRDWLADMESLPVDSVWHGGHVLPRTGTGEVITRLALLTAWTERVRIGSAVLLLPLYHPVVVAKQLADLDSRSGGASRWGSGWAGSSRRSSRRSGCRCRSGGPAPTRPSPCSVPCGPARR
jgi:alkanesulfonate monooxygenase SsuD/methylene tetrahydromethanopterin reductase-like flavin-dependent oxidoreductase (luciferase family)